MFITDYVKNGVKIIELNGRIEGEAGDFSDELNEMIKGRDRVLFDCSKMNYINSAGLRVFLSAAKDILGRKGRMAICGLQKNVHEVFTVSGFIKQMNVYPNRDVALEGLK